MGLRALPKPARLAIGCALAFALLASGYWLGRTSTEGRRGPPDHPALDEPPRDSRALPDVPLRPRPAPGVDPERVRQAPGASPADWIKGFLAQLPRDPSGCLGRLSEKIAVSEAEEEALIAEALARHLFEDDNPAVRDGCAACLILFPEEAFEPLRTAFESEPRADVRRTLAFALGRIGKEGAIEPLARAVQEDRDVLGGVGLVGNMAIGAIGHIEGPQAVRALTALWEDPGLSRDAKRLVLSSLGDAGQPSSLELVFGALGSKTDEYIRGMAAYALGQIATRNKTDQRALARVRPVLRKCLGDANTEVRRNAALGLACVGEAQDIPALRALADTDDAHHTVSQGMRDGSLVYKTVYPVREMARLAVERIARRLKAGGQAQTPY